MLVVVAVVVDGAKIYIICEKTAFLLNPYAGGG